MASAKLTAGLFILLGCFLYVYYVYCIASKPAEKNTAQKSRAEMQTRRGNNYSSYLLVSLAAASSGKTFFKQSKNLTKDCVKTARVTMYLFSQPSTYYKIYAMMYSMITNETIVMGNLTENTEEKICKYLNETVQQREYNISNFEELKKNVTLPSTLSETHLLDFPDGSNKDEFHLNSTIFNDTQIVKFAITWSIFHSSQVPANVILKLSERDVLKAAVDEVFKCAYENYYEKKLRNTTSTNIKELFSPERVPEGFLKNVDKYFRENSTLAEEYQKLYILYDGEKTRSMQAENVRTFNEL